MNPVVSVLMPVYNGERYLKEAVNSILVQSLTDFEFIIVNDASTDGTPELIASFSDPRIVRIDNKINVGVPESLNCGLKLCRGKYVARMDADDLSDANRLASQVGFLENNPGIAVLGTGTTKIDEEGVAIGWDDYHSDPISTAWRMTWRCAIAHPSVMMNKEMILSLGGYNTDIRHAEDYDLWTRVIEAGGRISVLPERLLQYRNSPSQVSCVHTASQERDTLDITHRHMNWLLGKAIKRELVEDAVRLLSTGRVYGVRNVFLSIALINKLRTECERILNDETGELMKHISDAFESNSKIAFTDRALVQSLMCLAFSVYLQPTKLVRPASYRSLRKIRIFDILSPKMGRCL